MARFLSAEWFEQLDAERRRQGTGGGPSSGGPSSGGPSSGGPGRVAPPIALEISVPDAPDGAVRYQVVVEGASSTARWREEDLVPADVKFTTDYGTISRIASGGLPAVEALAQGRARVSGNTSLLARLTAPIDSMPASVRATTTY